MFDLLIHSEVIVRDAAVAERVFVDALAAPDAFAALAKGTMPSGKASLYRARSDVAGHPVGRTRFSLIGMPRC